MKPTTVLCISCGPEAGKALLQRLGVDLREDLHLATPQGLNTRRAMPRYRAVILDGYSLGERSIEVARQLRWLGIDDPILLAWQCDSPLDRAIARECGVDGFISPACGTRLGALLEGVTGEDGARPSARLLGARQGKRQPGTGSSVLRTNETASVQL